MNYKRNTRQLALALACSTLLLGAPLAEAESITNELKAIRVSENPNYTRLVFDMKNQATFHSHVLNSPTRIFVDLVHTAIPRGLKLPAFEGNLVQRMRHGQHKPTIYRVTFDLNQPAAHNVFLLPPNGPYGHRVVLDIFEERSKEDCAQPARGNVSEGDVVIVVDAGHGGEDPGAVKWGKLEKNITLSIANTLAARLNQLEGFTAIPTRTEDVALSLGSRRAMGQKHKAHLFVSIHADSYKRASARGASVFMLAKGRADSELAKWLAKNENRADMHGGVADWIDPNCITDTSIKQEVVQILGDKQKDATVVASERVGQSVLNSLARVTQLHPKNRVSDSEFYVLKSTSVPSILVETGFLSNPIEARLLSNPNHQRKVAHAIAQGIRTYFCATPPWRTKIQEDESLCDRLLFTYVVQRRDTLSKIAKTHGVSVRALQRANGLTNDMINIGDVLTIPSLSEG